MAPAPVPAGIPHSTDPAALAAATGDFGGWIRHPPRAVCRPRSQAEVARFVAHARRHDIPWVTRGCAHSLTGGSQIRDGVVLDTGGLDEISIAGSVATAGAGAKWSRLLRATTKRGLAPPVLTDYLETSIGGTLSAGGIGGATHRHGFQTDNLTELSVVTVDGEPVICSPEREAALFDAVRAGGGEHGVITSARLPLRGAPNRVHRLQLYYEDLPTFLADQRTLMSRRRFDYLEGQAEPAEDGGWRYFIEVALAGSQPYDALIADLRHDRGATVVEEMSFPEFAGRLGPAEELLRELGQWRLPHPWCNVFLPGPSAVDVLTELMSRLPHEDIGEFGTVLIYPFDASRCATPGLRLPAADTVFLLALLRTAPDHEPDTVERLLRANDSVARLAAEHGGTVYLPWR